MTVSQRSKDVPVVSAEKEVQDWMEEHLAELKRSVSGQHFLYWSLVISFVVGLAAHVGGFLLRPAAPGGLTGLFADLLYALGWSLWTGVVVTLLVQVIPEAKRRQIRKAIRAYEASRREKTEAGGRGDGGP